MGSEKGGLVYVGQTQRVQKLFPAEPLLLEAELLEQVVLDVCRCACVHACMHI